MCHLYCRNFCIKYTSHFQHVAAESFTNVKKYQHLHTFRVFFRLFEFFYPPCLKPKNALCEHQQMGNQEEVKVSPSGR